MGKSSSAKARITEYRMSMHVGIGHALDAITDIRIDEKVAWSGRVSTNTAININQPNLFGGQQKEGGLVGTVQVLLGDRDQVLPPAAANRYGHAPQDCPAFRGLTTLFFHGNGIVSTGRANDWSLAGYIIDQLTQQPIYNADGFLWKSNSPVIAQKIEVTGVRAPKGLSQTHALSADDDANFAHIIYECLTNTDWGMGGLPSLINKAGFEAAAERLASEGMFGSVWWMRQSTVEDFVVEMVTHIQATLFLNPNTGLLDIKLLRGDYDVADLRHITPQNAVLSNFKRRSGGEIVNEMTVDFTNPVTEQTESITAQDIASIQSQGGEKVSGSRSYYAFRNRDLATFALQRDLRASTAPLISADASLDRSAWDLLPGEVVLMSWPKRSTWAAVMRVGKVNYGKPLDSKIKTSMLQDVFSLSQPPIALLPGSEWSDPRAEPQPLTMQLFTVPAYFTQNGELQSSPVTFADSEALVGAVADSETYDSLDYELVSESTTAAGDPVFTSKGAMSMTGLAFLSVALSAAPTSLLPLALYPIPDEAPRVGGFVLLGYGDENQEFALVTAQSEEGWTVSRGCLDTTPRSWAAGTPVWVINPGAKIVDTQTVHGEGTTATYRGLDRTALGLLKEEDAPPVSTVVSNRPHAPLRPANVKVNGVGFGPVPIGSAANIDVTWATRNRLLEDTQVLNWTTGPVTPEYRQETVVRFLDFSGALIAEYDGFWDQNGYSFPTAYFAKYASVTVEVVARRDGVESLTGHRITITGLPGDIGAPPPGPGVDPSNPPSYLAAPAVGAYEITGGSTFGGEVQTILVTGTPDNRDASHLLIRYRVAPGPDDADWTETSPYFLDHNRQTHSVDIGLLAKTNYEVEVAYIVGGIPSRWRNIGQVVTGGIDTQDLLDRLIGVEEINETVQQGIADLEAVYGDTASAAASAAAAVEAKSDAIQAKADALIAASDASERASEASEERIKAETARGLAESYRNQAADSVTAAGLSAASASEDAGLAATARGEAQGFAGAALDASNAAAGFVTDAEAAAAVSTTQKLEAVAALNAMGRQNIVARENVTTPADVFTVTTAGLSGWGFSMVGSGGVVVRDIKVGPLKKNTAYSLSFLARRGGVDPVPLNVDLFPDSLPQTAFNVTSENWSRFTWEGVTSASDDMALATVSLRFFATMPAENAFEITDIKLEEGATATAYTPSPKDAATSAKASAQSASQAFASQTLASESAGASETAKLAAQTARGQAEGFKNQAVQAYQDAQGQASIATTQAGLAAGSATLAGDKAQAASESASLASTKADAAGTSAQAAEVSKLQAASSYDAAAQILYQQFPPTLAPDSRGSYEGYGSIAGPSDWPTPYISQELPGTISNREFRHKRRIPKVVGKRYRFECWVFTYATNVRFEANLHDFPEATGAGGIRFRRMMSAAPTGSPNIKPPTQTFTLVAGEFEVLSDDQAFLGPYLTAKTDDGQPSNGLTHIGGIAITDITSEKKATTAAEAAIINAASAETFAGQSEDWAEASEEQYLLAKGSAGEAKGYSEAAVEAKDGAVIASSSSALSATASDTARDLTEKARDKAFEHRNAASNSAGLAEDKAAEADAFAASASISASLAASTSALRGNLLPNGGMERGLEGISGQNLYVSNDSWGPAVRVAPTGNGTYTVNWAPADIFGGGTYTVSGDALLFAESGSRYFDMIFLDANGGIAGDSGQKPMGPGDYSNDRTRINAMAWTEQAPSNAAKVVVRAVFEGVVNPTAMGARRVKLEFGPGPATAYTADGAVDALSAQLNITKAVAADAQTRLASVLFEIIGASGGDPFQLLFKTVGSSSLGQMVASALRFGNVIGGQIVDVMKLVGGSVFITGKLLLGAAGQIELDPAYPLILWKFGSARLAIGQIPNDQLFFWFGPSVEVSQMRRNNATVYMDRNGRGHWMGAITAGTISNSIQGSNVNVPASAALGPFSTNGGPIVVNWSYSFDRTGRRWGNQTGGVSGTTSALVRLYQKIGNGAETLVDTMTVNGDLSATYDGEPVPGQPGGTVGQTFISEYMGASKTYTDNVGGTAARTYRVEVASRSNKSVSGQSPAADSMDQRYGATSSE